MIIETDTPGKTRPDVSHLFAVINADGVGPTFPIGTPGAVEFVVPLAFYSQRDAQRFLQWRGWYGHRVVSCCDVSAFDGCVNGVGFVTCFDEDGPILNVVPITKKAGNVD